MSTFKSFIESIHREERLRTEVEVKVLFNEDDACPFSSYTHEVTRSGVRLARVGGIQEVEQCLWLQRKDRKAKYRVIWIGAPGTILEGQIGLELMDTNVTIWE